MTTTTDPDGIDSGRCEVTFATGGRCAKPAGHGDGLHMPLETWQRHERHARWAKAGRKHGVGRDALRDLMAVADAEQAALHADLAPDIPELGSRPAADTETTARVLSALHRSAEETVTRCIALYERWLAAGPPPFGTSTARWWDARLAELHDALNPPKEK
ncbi:hypothetical protein [Streptomyces corynorhini]|uniref:Uncharacterized protein n=1 Tax=Streptomyces corynorhini TaxID=2282652 RepID=A0A370B5P1_9ACTN|nr:hypothetical protein [Streptomyces corynorhini]RDG35183.1 hypothetical protein DVH02_26665 [Streptomyces corynorhini]